MDPLVEKYLNHNYVMQLDDYMHGCVKDVNTNRKRVINDVISEIETIFSFPRAETHKMVNSWWDSKELPYILSEMNTKLHER